MNIKAIKEALDTEHVSRKRDGSFRYWKSYFYHHGLTSEVLAERLLKAIPTAVVVDKGDHFHSFVGGAASGSPQDSYIYVIFTVPE